MCGVITEINPAVRASQEALSGVFNCLDNNKNFILEAGAGAGKTYCLVESLKYILANKGYWLAKRRKRVACITYTNVARGMIESRIDRNKLIFCDTIHGFNWHLIANFQNDLKRIIFASDKWVEKLDGIKDCSRYSIDYSLGYRSVRDEIISIHHDDVLSAAIELMKNDKFRSYLSSIFPIILVDEYQDANSKWINAIHEYFLSTTPPPLFGFFGDHWQKIYGDGCGLINHSNVKIINNEANFRSSGVIVDCLNKIRPNLKQYVYNHDLFGSVNIFHTNNWVGTRQVGAHWKDDLPSEVSHRSLDMVCKVLSSQGWDFDSDKTKILMLTHKVLASEQGYSNLANIFTFNDSFLKPDNEILSFFHNNIEPACADYSSKKFGNMFLSLDEKKPLQFDVHEKKNWKDTMNELIELRVTSSVGDVLNFINSNDKLKLPDKVLEIIAKIENLDDSTDVHRSISESAKLLNVDYKEVIELSKFIKGHSPFDTKHGVKGAEFENVLVVIGRGWNLYNFNEMLECAKSNCSLPPSKTDFLRRNMNLFYVVCSRAKQNLSILFTQRLSPIALEVLGDWFGVNNIHPLSF